MDSRRLAGTDGAVKALYDPADAELKVALAAVQRANDQVQNNGVDSLLALILERQALFLLLHTPQQLHGTTSNAFDLKYQSIAHRAPLQPSHCR